MSAYDQIKRATLRALVICRARLQTRKTNTVPIVAVRKARRLSLRQSLEVGTFRASFVKKVGYLMNDDCAEFTSTPEFVPAVRKLSDWILSRSPQGLTHLKLQKLVFYCYGAAVANDFEGEIGTIELEAWEHGPVSRSLWQEHRGRAAEVIQFQGGSSPRYSSELEKVLCEVLTVYGALDAWSLRNQSHLESPWQDAFKENRAIRRDELGAWAKSKFVIGPAFLPEYLSQQGSFALEQVPPISYESFEALAAAVYKIRHSADEV
jgi:uncharacterized phage-associated protein